MKQKVSQKHFVFSSNRGGGGGRGGGGEHETAPFRVR